MSAVVMSLLVDLQTADVPITKDNVKPGWVALGIVFALGVGLFLLLRSMAKHVRKAAVPWEGEEPDDQLPEWGADESADSDSPSSR